MEKLYHKRKKREQFTQILDVIKNKLCLLVHSEYLTFLITRMPYHNMQLYFLIVI